MPSRQISTPTCGGASGVIRSGRRTTSSTVTKCDLDPNYVGYIERAERAVNVIVIFKRAAVLGVAPAELFEGITLKDAKKLPKVR